FRAVHLGMEERKTAVVERASNRLFVADLTLQLERFGVEMLGSRLITLPVGNPAGGLQGRRPLDRMVAADDPENALCLVAPFVEVAADLRETPKRRDVSPREH